MVRSVPQSNRSTPAASRHASSMPPSTPLPERSTYTFVAAGSAASECRHAPHPPVWARMNRTSARTDAREARPPAHEGDNEPHGGLAAREGGELRGVRRLLSRPLAPAGLPYLM